MCKRGFGSRFVILKLPPPTFFLYHWKRSWVLARMHKPTTLMSQCSVPLIQRGQPNDLPGGP